MSSLSAGEVIKVLPGSQVPLDGRVLEGHSTVNESMLTGEALPVPKGVCSRVVGGTLNGGGVLWIQVAACAADSTLAQIAAVVADAQHRRPKVQAFADTVSRYFVPVIVGLALLTYLCWTLAGSLGMLPEVYLTHCGLDNPQLFAFMFGCAVLVVACPCALGLATPTAVMVGGGVASKHGILIKGGDVLESAATVTALLFDKTGTLTRGVLQVVDVVMWPNAEAGGSPQDATGKPTGNGTGSGTKGGGTGGGISGGTGNRTGNGTGDASAVSVDEYELLTLAASAEKGSEHPIGKAIVSHATARGLTLTEPTDFGASAGHGLSCRVRGRRVLVGNRGWMAAHGLELAGRFEAALVAAEECGHTAVLVAAEAAGSGAGVSAKDSKVAALALRGMVAVSDTLKPEARAVLSHLQARGLECWMVTGDNARTAHYVAELAGVPPDRVLAEVKPQGKADKVRALQQRGHVVAMVGDGVNDAPALAMANVGIAVASGTHVAIEAADIVLMKSHLADVHTALDLSAVVMRRIRINFVWAFGYNVAMVPFAAGVLYPWLLVQLPPMFAGLAMALSSVSVVCSSLMLHFYTPPDVRSPAGSGGRRSVWRRQRPGVTAPAETAPSSARSSHTMT